jgi:hypothetical protein
VARSMSYSFPRERTRESRERHSRDRSSMILLCSGCFVLDCSSQNSCQFHHTSFASVSQILIILDLLESSSIMPRNSRQRGCTLLPGSPFHDAFFSQDESIRDAFDQEAVIAKFCKNRRKMWVRRRDTGSFLKSGRPMFPRYASF